MQIILGRSQGQLFVPLATLLAVIALAWVAWQSARSPLGWTPTTSGVLEGICEASSVLADGEGYLIGDNEGELQLYRWGPDLTQRAPLDLGAEVEDIEALTRLPGDGLLVVGSQGANKKGKRRPLREQVLVVGAAPVRPDLSGCVPCVEAVGRAPKEGGLSVEGAAWWRGALWLGLRSPLVEGSALLLELRGDPTKALEVARVVPVDLGERGVRELVVVDGSLLLLAGPPGKGDQAHALYRIDEGFAASPLSTTLPAHSEGLVVEGGGLLLVMDGDGSPGAPCKEPARWLRLPLRREDLAPADPR